MASQLMQKTSKVLARKQKQYKELERKIRLSANKQKCKKDDLNRTYIDFHELHCSDGGVGLQWARRSTGGGEWMGEAMWTRPTDTKDIDTADWNRRTSVDRPLLCGWWG